ncbi:hypothetical protein C0Z16_18885 [Paraburkholderia rhynchosiae]|uniref:Uncharacterized protein n=1 Tax=Paraburkholderia rhynchosiae TaxID=487049 RepID=A0ABX4V3Z4_9BURK|nr:hypothetical protein C0Z16_18885 [Paraburkholderia rhynchosiae]
MGQCASPSAVPSITGVAAANVGVVALVSDAPVADDAAPDPLLPPPPPPQPARIRKTPIATNREPSRCNIADSMPWLKRDT